MGNIYANQNIDTSLVYTSVEQASQTKLTGKVRKSVILDKNFEEDKNTLHIVKDKKS